MASDSTIPSVAVPLQAARVNGGLLAVAALSRAKGNGGKLLDPPGPAFSWVVNGMA